MKLQCIICPDCGVRGYVIFFTVDMADRVAGFCPQHIEGFFFRSHNPDDEEVFNLLSQAKRQKSEVSCVEEELLNYRYHLVSEKRKRKKELF